MIRQNQDNINTPEHFDTLYAGPRREEMLPYEPLKVLLPLLVTGGNVLDVGCGWGQYHDILSCNGSFYYGIDFAPGAIIQARIKFPHDDWREEDFSRKLPYDDGFFSHVVCLETLEHVEDPFRLIIEILRVLRPGGTAILSVPYRDGVVTPEHLWEYDEIDWRLNMSVFSVAAQFRYCNVPGDEWEHFLIVARK